jgi:hypothetical protein
MFFYGNGGDIAKLTGQLQYQIKESNWPFSARPATFSVRRKFKYLKIIVIKQILQCSFFLSFMIQNDELPESFRKVSGNFGVGNFPKCGFVPFIQP